MPDIAGYWLPREYDVGMVLPKLRAHAGSMRLWLARKRLRESGA